MTEVPKIVHDRLRAAALERVGPGAIAPEQVHLDADVLTAFAEQALSASERENVLEHLARCGDCREVLALALPPVDIVAAPIGVETDARATGSRAGASAPPKLNFAWPTLAWPALRWAALAAGVAVAAAVLLLHPGKLNQAALPSASRTAAPVASGPPIAISPAASSPVATPSTNQIAVLAKTEGLQSKPELPVSKNVPKKLKARQAVMPAHPAEYGMLLADNKKDSSPADQAPAAPSARARAFNYDAPAGRGANETVEVSGATVAVETESSALKAMAQNDAPVVRAKPAPQGIGGNGLQKAEAPAGPGTAMLQARNVMSKSAAKLTSSASPALAHSATWAITTGVLQRSPDGGQSWQEALRADHLLLCYASRNQDVWAGGQSGTLFHSANSGVTWLRVQPSIKDLPLTSDITHIDVRGPAEVVISTSNREIWSSADSGNTWERK
jgi:Photosynthesis system II assembly factor YCF48/Putative zinc-finger